MHPMADFRKWLYAFALVSLLAFLSVPADAQLFRGTLIDTPSHAFAVGGGIGPSSRDFSVIAGFGELISSTSGTYSYSGVSIVPAFVTNAFGQRNLAITTVAHTGIKQALFQSGRFTLLVDGGAGASLPSSQTTAFNFAAVAGLDIAWRLTKTLNTAPGAAANYLVIEPQFTQLTGSPGGTVVSIGLAWVHGVH